MLRTCRFIPDKTHRLCRNNYRLYFNSAINHESFANGTSSSYLEDMYRLWQTDRTKVHASWDAYFQGIDKGRPVGSAYVSPPSLSLTVGASTVPAVAPSTSQQHSPTTVTLFNSQIFQLLRKLQFSQLKILLWELRDQL